MGVGCGGEWCGRLVEGLHVDKAFVKAVVLDKLVVVAAFDDVAVVEYDDLVGVANG